MEIKSQIGTDHLVGMESRRWGFKMDARGLVAS